MFESKAGILFIAGIGFFAFAFLSNAVVPMVMYKDLPEQTAEQVVNDKVMYQFKELSRRYPVSFREHIGEPTADNFRLSQPFSLTEHPLETYCKEDVDFLILSSLNAARYFESDADRFAEERAWYDRLDTRTRVVHRIDGKGALELHHPAIEIRRLFCSSDQRNVENR